MQPVQPAHGRVRRVGPTAPSSASSTSTSSEWRSLTEEVNHLKREMHRRAATFQFSPTHLPSSSKHHAAHCTHTGIRLGRQGMCICCVNWLYWLRGCCLSSVPV